MEQKIKSKRVHQIIFYPHSSISVVTKDIMEKNYCGDLMMYKQFSLYEVMKLIRSCPQFLQFIETMNSLRYDALYKSNIHGVPHIERVVILAFILSVLYQLDYQSTFILLEAAKYHDIGRIDDGNDFKHGMRGAEKYNELFVTSNRIDSRIIMALIEAHSVNDEKAESIFDKYDIPKKLHERVRKLLYFLKDADSLDRFRLTDHSLKTKFLRYSESHKLIEVACEMANYDFNEGDV